MQLTDIRDRVRERVGLDSSDPMAADAYVTPIVNAANRQIALEQDWDWLVAEETIAVSTDDDEVAVAADWRMTLYVGRLLDAARPDGYSPLIRAQWRELRYANSFGGIPTLYAIQAGVLRLAPTPAAAETLLHIYIKSVTALSADSDEPEMPDDYIDYLVVRTAKLLATRIGDREMMQMLREEERDLNDSIVDEQSRTRDSFTPRVRSDTRWGG